MGNTDISPSQFVKKLRRKQLNRTANKQNSGSKNAQHGLKLIRPTTKGTINASTAAETSLNQNLHWSTLKSARPIQNYGSTGRTSAILPTDYAINYGAPHYDTLAFLGEVKKKQPIAVGKMTSLTIDRRKKLAVRLKRSGLIMMAGRKYILTFAGLIVFYKLRKQLYKPFWTKRRLISVLIGLAVFDYAFYVAVSGTFNVF